MRRDTGSRCSTPATYNDLERAAALLRVIPLLRQSRVLISPPFKGTPESFAPEQVKAVWASNSCRIADGRYDEVLANVDAAAAEAEAQQWLDEAEQLVEPKREDVVKAARASLTLHQLIAENQAHGLCVGTCMGWLPRGFPCLGFSRLNDRGIPAACDGDADCVLTMLMFQHALNQPGFLGNAAGVDTARNAFHLSHCSAPLRMEGPAGPAAPYLLRRHAEVRGGAVPEVHYRIGQTVTFTKLIHLETLLVFTGRSSKCPRSRPAPSAAAARNRRRSGGRGQAAGQLGRRGAGREREGLLCLLAPRGLLRRPHPQHPAPGQPAGTEGGEGVDSVDVPLPA